MHLTKYASVAHMRSEVNGSVCVCVARQLQLQYK